jgi:hypothetical protein
MTALMVRRALADYARRPLNLVLLVAVPVVIVIALAGDLAAMSKLLSSTAKPGHLEVSTAGWAAAAVAGLAGFFQVAGARAADRRLASIPGAAGPVVAGRLLAGVGLAVAAAAAASVALLARGGMVDPVRAIPTVLMVAVLYVAIGVLVATVVRSEMNGALLVSVIWMLDVFVGSGVGGSSALYTRFFPLHFPTMVLTGQAAHHSGALSNLGWSLLWTAGLAAIAAARYASTTRPARTARHAHLTVTTAAEPTFETIDAGGALQSTGETAERISVPAAGRTPRLPGSPSAAGLWAAVREYRRDRVLWALLLVVPVTFVALAAAQTPTKPMPVALINGARHFTTMISLRHIHAGEMASIASALLAGITGLFVVTGSADGDRRLVLAGFKPRQALTGHLGVIAGAAVLTSALSLAISAAFFTPRSWVEYAGADILIALTYAMIGVLLGPLVGRLGGLYLLLLLSIVDVGYGQTVMFHPNPPGWGAFLPARGGERLMLDGAFTTGFEQYGPLLLGLGWLAALTLAAVWVFRRRTGAVAATALAAVTSGPGDGSTRSAMWPSQEAQNCFMASSQEGTNMSSEDTQEATT